MHNQRIRQCFKLLLSLIVCVLILSVMDGSAQRAKKAKRRGQTQRIASKSQGIRAEAEAEANKLVDIFLTRCGDSYYSYYGGIKEWSGLHLLVDHKPPSQADKLNGIEWNAMVLFQFDAERVRLDSRWQDPVDMMCFEIWKENSVES